ncbi:MAG: dTMP kinase, partial [Thermodesulfobacteriota bacterium]
GKGTQAGLLKEFLLGQGRKVRLVREPGSTPIGESIRDVLLTSKGDGMGLWTELFLYEACRAELAATVIGPALDAGKVVICDRFTDSTIAYQGYGRGLDIDTLRGLNTVASQEKVPNLTILLDCPVELGLERAQKRMEEGEDVSAKEDRFEREALEFHRRVRGGFLELAKQEPERIKVVSAEGSIEEVALRVRSVVAEFLNNI